MNLNVIMLSFNTKLVLKMIMSFSSRSKSVFRCGKVFPLFVLLIKQVDDRQTEIINDTLCKGLVNINTLYCFDILNHCLVFYIFQLACL